MIEDVHGCTHHRQAALLHPDLRVEAHHPEHWQSLVITRVALPGAVRAEEFLVRLALFHERAHSSHRAADLAARQLARATVQRAPQHGAKLQVHALALLGPLLEDVRPKEGWHEVGRPAQEGRLEVPSQHSMPWQSQGEIVVNPRWREVLP